jgi:hypothetical protein
MTNIPFSIERSNLLGTEAFRNLLGESLSNAKKSVIIFTAYIKVIGVEWLEQKLKDKNISCTIVSRWQKSDIAQAASDLDCYLICKKNNWTFKILGDLHAKLMVIDNNELFIGSPNLTGRGMSLVPVANKEMGIKTLVTDVDKKIIQNLADDAISVDDEIYNSIKEWKEKLGLIKRPEYPDFPEKVRDKLKENYKNLWVHSFPWSNPEDLLNIQNLDKNIIHDLEMFRLKKNEITKEKLELAFIDSKVYKWLVNEIYQTQKKEIYFGNLSSIIHNSLLDDPKPYRKTIKDFQSNLIKFIKFFDFKHLKTDIPGNKSERIYIDE